MKTEKWMCNKCGSECRVEIDFEDNEYTEGNTRFRGRCTAGTVNVPEDHYPEWVRQNLETGKLEAPLEKDSTPNKTQPKISALLNKHFTDHGGFDVTVSDIHGLYHKLQKLSGGA